MKLSFTKMQGCANDYIYLDCRTSGVPEEIAALSEHLSRRHFSIGADGIICICAPVTAGADAMMRIFNADGSEGKMCGNGIRCVAKYVYDYGLTDKDEISIATKSGIKYVKLQVENGKVKTVRVDMGAPILNAGLIPIVSENPQVINEAITAGGREYRMTGVSMGNPHAITFVNNVEEFDVEKYGKILEIKKEFPKHSNIEFVELIDKNNIKMRVWERGSGETLACGTGSCASVVACILNNKTERKVNVHLLGGTLEIEWNKQNNHVYMEGPAEIVFEGEIE